ADPRVAVLRPLDLVRHDLARLLHLGRVVLPPDQALDGVDRVLGVGQRLALGDLPDELLAALRERDDRRGRARALAARDHLGLAALHDRDAAIRGSEIDSDDLAHRQASCASASAPAPGGPSTLTRTSAALSTRS